MKSRQTVRRRKASRRSDSRPASQGFEDLDIGLLEVTDVALKKDAYDRELRHVNGRRFEAAVEFIQSCRAVALGRLQEGELPGEAAVYLSLMASELAATVQEIVEAGDLEIARSLEHDLECWQGAFAIHGSRLSRPMPKRLNVEEFLKKEGITAKRLVDMVAVLHPSIVERLHEPGQTPVTRLPEEQLRLMLLRDRSPSGPSTRKYNKDQRWAAFVRVIERIAEMAGNASSSINLFVEYLRRGWLWCGPNRVFEKCWWHGRTGLPLPTETGKWMRMIQELLEKVSERDPSRLVVFRYLLALRQPVSGGQNLLDGKPHAAWNQLMSRIRKAWEASVARESKRKSRKAA